MPSQDIRRAGGHDAPDPKQLKQNGPKLKQLAHAPAQSRIKLHSSRLRVNALETPESRLETASLWRILLCGVGGPGRT